MTDTTNLNMNEARVRIIADSSTPEGDAYCAPCHGEDARGNRPVARALIDPPPDLTTLAKRNIGKFPEDYVKKVLSHGVVAPAHDSSEMPIWGPIFAGINTRGLTHYLESVQTK